MQKLRAFRRNSFLGRLLLIKVLAMCGIREGVRGLRGAWPVGNYRAVCVQRLVMMDGERLQPVRLMRMRCARQPCVPRLF